MHASAQTHTDRDTETESHTVTNIYLHTKFWVSYVCGLVKKGHLPGFSKNNELKIQVEHGELNSAELKEKQPFAQINIMSKLYLSRDRQLYSTFWLLEEISINPWLDCCPSFFSFVYCFRQCLMWLILVLNCPKSPRIILNSWSSWFYFPSADTTGAMLGIKPSFVLCLLCEHPPSPAEPISSPVLFLWHRSSLHNPDSLKLPVIPCLSFPCPKIIGKITTPSLSAFLFFEILSTSCIQYYDLVHVFEYISSDLSPKNTHSKHLETFCSPSLKSFREPASMRGDPRKP